MSDLVTLSQAQSELAVSLPVDTSALQAVISAASKQVQRYTKRDFFRHLYSEILSGRGFSSILTRQYPINAISRMSVNPTKVLSVRNLDPVANQRATANLATTGDVASGVVVTGLALYRMAAAVATTVTLDFATYTTVDSLATAINSLGSGWQATADSSYRLWPTGDFQPDTGAQSALSGSADFQAFVTDVSAYDYNGLTGEIRMRNQTYDPVFALMNLANTSALSVFPIGYLNLLVVYDAGYTTIPEDVQQATLVCIRDWVYHLQTVTTYQSESDVDWSNTLSPMLQMGLPEASRRILQPYRSFRTW